MVELVRPMYDAENSSLRFYCWPHLTVHEFGLKDVEAIVYALGAEAIDAYESGFNDGLNDDWTRPPEDPPACLLEVLRGADNSEAHAEHVAKSIECRERADA